MQITSKIKKISLFCIIFLIPLLSYLSGYCEIPEEDRVKDSDLNFEAAAESLERIEIALKDFRDFTDIILTNEVLDKLRDKKSFATVKISSTELKKFTTIDWPTQNIGFINWAIVLRGTLLKSAYLTRKYEYELAKCQKNLVGDELSKLKKGMKDALTEYQKFLNQVHYID